MNIKIGSHLVKITTVTYLTRLCIGIQNQAQYASENSRAGITGGPISTRLPPFARRRLSAQAYHHESLNFRDHGGSDDQGAAINGYVDSDDHDNIFVRFRVHQKPNITSDFSMEETLQTMVEVNTTLDSEYTSDDFNYEPVMERDRSDEILSRPTDLKILRRQQRTASTLWVQWHNFYRRQYPAPDLIWDQNLANRAQRFTNRCYFQHSAPERHGPPYGENLFAGASDIPGVLNAWVNGPNEAGSYNPRAPTYSHFTQVVWRGTRRVGCAITQCNYVGRFEGSRVYQQMGRKVPNIACVYFPAGNVIGQFPQNVIVPKVRAGHTVPVGSKVC